MQPTSPKPGILPRIRTRLFGEHDAVDEQLRDIARQGTGMARIAHSSSFLLIVLFSAGSLVALSGDALVHIAAAGIQPATIPALISTAVSTLLVTCMDVALIYAASMLRILNARRAESAEKRIHVAVLICASVLESGTYVFMAYQYDRPVALAAWILVIARALAAPLFSVYLSMARALPVGPRDILYQVELSTGRGVIRDAVGIANDTNAPLARKMQLYSASAVMAPADRDRLEQMIETMRQEETVPLLTPPDASNTSPDRSLVLTEPTPLPDPDPAPSTHKTPSDQEPVAPGDSAAAMMRSNVRVLTLPPPATRTLVTRRTSVRASVRADAGRSKRAADELRQKRVEIAREILSAQPRTGVRDLARRIALASKHRISTSTANDLRLDVLAEFERERTTPSAARS